MRRIVVARPTAAALACAEPGRRGLRLVGGRGAGGLLGIEDPVLLAVHSDAGLGEELNSRRRGAGLVGGRARRSGSTQARGRGPTCAHATPRGLLCPISARRSSALLASMASGRSSGRRESQREALRRRRVLRGASYKIERPARTRRSWAGPAGARKVHWSASRVPSRMSKRPTPAPVRLGRALRLAGIIRQRPWRSACYGLRGGYGPARAVACVVHTATRTSLTTCAGRHVAYVADEEDVQEDEPEVGALCHVGFGVAPSVAAWLHHNIARRSSRWRRRRRALRGLRGTRRARTVLGGSTLTKASARIPEPRPRPSYSAASRCPATPCTWI